MFRKFEKYELSRFSRTETTKQDKKYTQKTIWSCLRYHMTWFVKIENFEIYMDRIWRWRHRSWPDSEKSLALYKFSIDYDKKRIRSIPLTSFEKKIQNCPPFKKISTLTILLPTIDPLFQQFTLYPSNLNTSISRLIHLAIKTK